MKKKVKCMKMLLWFYHHRLKLQKCLYAKRQKKKKHYSLTGALKLIQEKNL